MERVSGKAALPLCGLIETLQIGISLGAGYTAAPAKRISVRRVILSRALLRLATE